MRTARSSSHLLGGLPQCMLGYTTPPRCGSGDTLVWAWRHPPLGVALETPPFPGVNLETPAARPSTYLLGVGLETPHVDIQRRVKT